MELITRHKIDPTEIHKILSYNETQAMSKLIEAYILQWHIKDPNFKPGFTITKNLWVSINSHYLSMTIDIMVEDDPKDYKDKFNGPIFIYETSGEFLLARELAFIKNNQRLN